MTAQSNKSTLQTTLERIGFEFSLAKSQTALIVAITFLVISVLMYKQQQARMNWPTAEGRVTDVTTKTDASGETRYVGVISYSVDGRTYSIQSDTSTAWKTQTGGTKMLVYNPNDPSKASVKMNNIWKWIFIIAFPVCGSLLLLYALLGFVFIRRY